MGDLSRGMGQCLLVEVNFPSVVWTGDLEHQLPPGGAVVFVSGNLVQIPAVREVH